MSSTLRNVTSTTVDSEKQVRNGQDHVRVFDPVLHKRLGDILEVLNKIETHLSIVTGEDDL